MLLRGLIYFLTVAFLLCWPVTSHADCEKYLAAQRRAASAIIDARIRKLETLRQRRFDSVSADSSSARAAQVLLEALARDGSPIDLDIYEAFLELDEALPAQPLAETREKGVRPRAPYLRANESWASLVDYFYDSPSALTVTRVEDLNYLRHVLGTARMLDRSVSREEVIRQANKSWQMARLNRFESVREAFTKWIANRSHADIARRLLAKIHAWAKAPKLSAGEAVARQKALRVSQQIAQSSSTFDLFLLENYFEHVHAFGVLENETQSEINNELQATDWRNFSSNLKLGSLSFIADFAESASHDTELKAYLMAILIKMKMSKRDDFATSFEIARWHVDAEIGDVPAPESYQSDLSIFTLIGRRDPYAKPDHVHNTPFVTPLAGEIQVRWNTRLGRLEASLIRAVPLRKHLRVAGDARLVKFLDRYFDYFRNLSSYQDMEIAQHRQYEMNASLVRNTYVVFTRPEFPDEAVATVKIFNGSPIDFTDEQLQRMVNDPQEMQSSIEHVFPHLVLEERKSGGAVREIGRMLSHPVETKKGFPVLMARVADLLYSSGARGSAYFYGVKKVRDHHVNEGAEIVFLPEDLRLPEGSEDKWVMRMSVDELAAKYFSNIFEAIRLRQPPSQFLVDGPTPEMVHSHVAFDGPPGFSAEAAILRQEEGEPTLLITHRQGDDVRHEAMVDNSTLALVVDGMAGTGSSLELENGRLVIVQHNESIGRWRWERRLEVAFIDGEYVITRFQYAGRDTILTRLFENCDFDLLRGVGFKNGKPVTINKTRLRLKTLADHEALHTCSGW